MDWRSRQRGRHLTTANENDARYVDLLHYICTERRFFKTKKGRFGMGPCNIKEGDSIVAILGHKVPFVLRKYEPGNLETNATSDNMRPMGSLFKFLGEAYCDDVMHYDGDIRADMEKGSLKTRRYRII